MKYVFAILLLSVFVAGCSGEIIAEKQVVNPITNIGLDSWKNTELVNIQNENVFSISEYAGNPVLIETFAIWCPTCLRQQQALNELDVAHVVVNIDPEEDAQLVKEYIAEHGFSAPYVIASEEFTKQLIQTFGIEVASAPSAPVILVCPNGDSRLLERGFKTASELQEAVNSCA